MYLKTALFGLYLFSGFSIASTDITLSTEGNPFIDVSKERNFAIGRTTFTGIVIVPACNLVMDNNYQIIDMGVTQVSELQNSALRSERKLILNIINCDLGKGTDSGHLVEMLFEWARVDVNSVNNVASGINLEIQDSRGNRALSGIPLPPQPLRKDEKSLGYTVRLENSNEFIQGGGYKFVLRFKVNYQ